MRSTSISLLWTIPFLALASPVLASDGVLEINQTCAVNTGCFPGDDAGFPVTISGVGGGSYRLTSDLALSDPDTHGIEISTNHVTLDLGGFMIRCRTFSFPSFSLCGAGGGSGDGVNVVNSFTAIGNEVRNGSIVGMGRFGVELGENSVVRDLRVTDNGWMGVAMGGRCLVSDNVVLSNGREGIRGTVGCSVSDNVVANNGAVGVVTSSGSTVSGNTVYSNEDGGIEVGSGCDVRENVVRDNGGLGIALTSTAAYRDNVISGNAGGTVPGGLAGGVNAGGNVCNGSMTCP